MTMLDAIGNTPLVQLSRVVPQGAATVYLKLEFYNPTGSYKDRMALSMIERAEQRGALRPGMTVVEYTGGSTGISLAFVCAVKGYRCRIVSSDAVAKEKLRSMEIFGAELEVLKSQGGKLTADLVPRMMARARELAAEGPSYATDQMRNPDMVAGYEPLGEELLRQVPKPIDVFCAASGTSGMLMGASRALKRAGANQAPRIIAFEPATSAVLSGGPAGLHERKVHVAGVFLSVGHGGRCRAPEGVWPPGLRVEMVRPRGIEPLTFGFVVRRSIHLS